MGSITINSTLILNGNLTCDGNITITASGKIIPISDEDLKKSFYNYISDTYITANGESRCITSTTGNILVEGSINGNGQGFESNTGPGCNSLFTDSTGGYLIGYGASHAGLGYIDMTGVSAPKSPYGHYETPVSLGSGSGYYHNPAWYLGEDSNGGGAIRLISRSGTCTINGLITMNGQSGLHAGGGSGGSIWVSSWDIDGTGTLSAAGGGTYLTSKAGGGGGGYISLWYDRSNNFDGTWSVSGWDGGGNGKYFEKRIEPILEERFTGTIYNQKWWDNTGPVTLNNSLTFSSPDGSYISSIVQSLFTVSGNILATVDYSGLDTSRFSAEFLLYENERNWFGVARKHAGIYGVSSVDGIISASGVSVDNIPVTLRVLKTDSTLFFQYYDSTSVPQTIYYDSRPELVNSVFNVLMRLEKPVPSEIQSQILRLSPLDIERQYLEVDGTFADQSAVGLNILGGSSQVYGYDFYTDIGNKVKWDTTSTDASVFKNVITSGDVVRILYGWNIPASDEINVNFDNVKIFEGTLGNTETSEPLIYVDSDYGSDSSDGQQLNPLKNLFVATAWSKRGGTIVLYDGTYNSTAVSRKDLTIRGAEGVKPLITTSYVQDTTGSGWETNALYFYGCQGIVENVRIANAYNGIYIENGNFDIIRNEIYDATNAVRFVKCDPTIARNNIHDILNTALDFTSCRAPNIVSNKIYDSSVAVYLKDTTDTIITSNTFDTNQIHMIFDRDSSGVVVNNNLTYADIGIQLETSVDVYNNNFFGVDTTFSNPPDNTANNFGLNPLYYDRPNRDYHLTTGSPDIDTGLLVYDDFQYDFDGVDRSSSDHTSQDIGAYQYLISTTNSGDYYVAGRGNDFWNNGDTTNPFKTLDKAMLVADSTIHIDGGHYDSFYLNLKSQNIDLNQLFIYVVPPVNHFVSYLTLDSTHINQGYISMGGFVEQIDPDATHNIALNVIGGSAQTYGTDYRVQYGSVVWHDLGLDGLLAAGDSLRILYTGALKDKALNTFFLHSHYSNLNKEKAIFVSPNGSDSTVLGGDGTNSGGNGSFTLPYRTVTKALEVSNPGDNIVLMSGEYPVFNGLANRIIVPVTDRTTVPDSKRYFEDYFAPRDFRFYGIPGNDIIQWDFNYAGDSTVSSGGGFLSLTYDGTNTASAVSTFSIFSDFEVSTDLRNGVDAIKFMVTSPDTTTYFRYDNLDYNAAVITGGESYICSGTLSGERDETSGDMLVTEYIPITSDNVRNGFVGLSYIPEATDCTNIAVNVVGGTSQNYGEDFYLEDSKIMFMGDLADIDPGEILRVVYMDRSLSVSVRVLISLVGNRLTIKAYDTEWRTVAKRDMVGNYKGPWKISYIMDTPAQVNHDCIYGKGYASKFLAIAGNFQNGTDKAHGIKTEKRNVVFYKELDVEL